MYAFHFARSYAAYGDAMARMIVHLKYHPVTPLASWFAARLSEVYRGEAEKFAADVLVPVPLHKHRLRKRGHNQADLIARPLAKNLHLPLNPLLLVRTRPRPERLKLTRRQRWETVKGAYVIREGAKVDKLRVLLIDDVFTTGATLDSCARALLRAGASSVKALTVGRVVQGGVIT